MRDFFIERPKAALVVALLLLLLGGVSIYSLPITQFPSITPPSVSVSATYIGANAITVEEGVTTPIEVQINGVPGLNYLTSNSTDNGASSIEATFELGTDIDIAALEVQNRVALAEPSLPEQVRRLGVTVRKRNPGLFMLVALISPNGSHDAKFLENYSNIFVKDELLRVEGIGDAFARTSDFAMRLWLEPDRMAQLAITPAEVVEALREQNLQVAAGAVGQPPQADAQAFEYTVFLDGRLETEAEFADVIIRNDPVSGSLIRLSDIGRAELGNFTYGNLAITNGQPASILILYQAPGSNALQTGAAVREAMVRLAERFPPDVEYLIPFEAVSVVRVSIEEVIVTLAIALALVTLVVFIFLQRWRATFIPLVAIPVSIVGTFIFFGPLGFTINTITLFGFVLAIGIVVDDAIVVVEAIQTKMEQEDMDVGAAARAALAEVATPVITTSVILAAIFLPVAFVPGLTGQLYKQFAVTISISVLLSSLVALSLAPALAVLLFRKDQQQPSWLKKVFGPFNRGFERMTHGYESAVAWSLAHRWLVGVAFAAVLAATYLLFQIVPSAFVPTEDDGRIFVTFELPEASATGRTVEVMREIMTILDSVEQIESYTGIAGLNAITFTQRSNTGTIFCQLQPWDDRTDDGEDVFALVGQLQQAFAKTIVDARVIVIPPAPIPGLGSTSGFSFALQDRNGNSDVAGFEQTLQDFLERINGREEIDGAFSFFTAQKPSYRLEVDRERAKQLGVPLPNIYSTIQTFLGSGYINDFTLYGRTFRVVAQADTAYRTSIDDLDRYYVRNTEGTMVPLGSLISYELTSSAPLIQHYNLFRSATVTGSPAEGFTSGEAIAALQEEAAELPRGYGFEFSGLTQEEVESGGTTVYIFALSILFAFLILTALYESWTVPLSVLLAAPLAIFGGLLALWLVPGVELNVYAQIGLISLVGLAAKDAILIVEFAKERVERGVEIVEATKDAARQRFRPILMTSATFVFGMIPLVTAGGAGANSRQAIGWVVIGGAIMGAIGVVFLVPYLYAVITKWAYSEEELEGFKEEAGEGD